MIFPDVLSSYLATSALFFVSRSCSQRPDIETLLARTGESMQKDDDASRAESGSMGTQSTS